jgi:hypothetical protein
MESRPTSRREPINVGRAVSPDAAAGLDPRKMLLVSSSGGVLLELLALEPWWSRHDVAWAAVPAADTHPLLAGQHVHWIGDVSVRRPLGLLPGLLRARRILRSERPDLVVSAGSGPAVPFFVLAALTDIPTLWISTLNVLRSPGLTARICARLASQVLLQHSSQRAAHPEGVVIGELY